MSKAGETLIIRNVCEVDAKLYQAFRRPRHRRPDRPRANRHLAAFPDDGDGQAYTDELSLDAADTDAAAQAAADEVVSKLDATDPIAGTGSPADAWRHIERLEMGVLLATLDILEQRGRLDGLTNYRHQAMGGLGRSRVDTAFYIRSLSNSGMSGDTSRFLQDTAEKLADLSVDERHDTYRYLIGKQQVSRDVEMLLEGFMAFEFAQVTWRKPVIDPGVSVGALPPEPIEPGPWTKSPNEPAELYIGKAAHREIAHYYRMINWTDTVFVNHRPMYVILQALSKAGIGAKGMSLTVKEGSMEPDILNISRMHIYEIKPAGRAAEAAAQVAMYVSILQKAGVSISLGPMGAPGTSGYLPAPAGVFIFSTPVPGVIAYSYRRGSLVPFEIPQGEESESPSWAWELKPLPKKESERLIVVTIVVTMVAVIAAVATAPFAS